ESDGLNMIRRVEDADAEALRPPTKKRGQEVEWNPYIPDSLKMAVRWFIIATAARRARGTNAHSSMLIHTAMKTDAHEETKRLLEPAIKKLKQDFYTDQTDWEGQWDEESATDRKSTRLNSSHVSISYAVFCLKKNT